MNKPSKTRILCLSELALLAALVLLMAFTPLGYLQTPWGLQITFIVVPVAIGAVILGPGAGAALGSTSRVRMAILATSSSTTA